VVGRRRVTGATVAALAAVVLGALPGDAGARRDDLPTESRSPVSGATVADATHGLDVRFTCPSYHQFSYDDVVSEAAEGYHVLLARAADVGTDGLLLPANRVDQRDGILVDGSPGLCTAAPDAAEKGLLPPEPGTWFWQSYRDCATYLCSGGVEVGDVWSVTVTKTVCSVNRAALATARRDLTTARTALEHHRTAARRTRVARLSDRVATLRSRLRVVYRCAG
jgi:hypothetical protein